MRKRYRSLHRPGAKQRIFIMSFVLCVLTSVLAAISQIFASQLFGWSSTVKRMNVELEFKPYLELSVTNIPLSVSVYDGDVIKIDYVNETELIIEKTDYSYMISQNPDFAFSLFAAEQLNYRLDILLPGESFSAVTIASASGPVDLTGISTEELYINSRSGNISVSHTGGDIVLKTFTGGIHADFRDYTGDSHLESASGNITVTISEKCEFNLTFSADNGYLFTNLFPENDELNDKKTRVQDGEIKLSKGISPNALDVRTTSGLFILKAAPKPAE